MPSEGAPDNLEKEVAALESSARDDPASLERLRALLAEGYLQNLLGRIASLRAEAADAKRASERSARDAEDARRRLAEEEERLLKLWDAYKSQEQEIAKARSDSERARRELDAVQASLLGSEARIAEKARETEAAEAEVRALEERLHAFESMKSEVQDVAGLKERAEEAERSARAEKERLAKLYAAYEEVEADRDRLAKELDEKLAWFQENQEALDQIVRSIRKSTPKPPTRNP